jgi:polygalacturonase
VEIDPATYNEVKRWTQAGTAAQPIIVRGVGAVRPVFDATSLTVDGALPNPRAVFQVEADYITLENLEFQNARNGDNGAGIRVTSGNNVTVTNCRITMCDMGNWRARRGR